MTSNQASHDSNFLDLNKLEAEVQNAVIAEKKYWCENDAKIRAVEQKVPTYDDFRELVLAAHLKPLEQKDKMDSIGKFKQVWNQAAGQCPKSGLVTKENSSTKKTGPNQSPKTGTEFLLHWKRCCKTVEEKKMFLFSFTAKSLREIFKVEIPGDVLGQCLECLQCPRGEEAVQVLDVLEALAGSQRFSLAVSFLSKKEQEICKQLFDRVGEFPEVKDDVKLKERLVVLTALYCKH